MLQARPRCGNRKNLGTVEETMSQAIDGRGDPPPPAKEATERFRAELGRELIPQNL
jgi:hypothetical protein